MQVVVVVERNLAKLLAQVARGLVVRVVFKQLLTPLMELL
jgi:hypothetical protein